MRLSATDRIIREAERHDDAAVEEIDHPDTEKVSAAPFVALGIPAPRMPAPLDGGVDIDLDDYDLGQDDEGETQVDAQRSAAALKEMRALQGAHGKAAPTLNGRADALRQRRLPSGRPSGTALTPAPGAPAPSPAITLTFGSGPGAIARGPLPPAPVVPPSADADDRPRHLFSSSRLQFGAIAMPPDPFASEPSLRRSGRVGRRTGIAIAASTAVAVALIAGAWTAKNNPPPPASAAIPLPPPVLPSSLRPGVNAATAPRPNGPVVVATAPSPAEIEPAPAEAPPSPTAAEEIAPPAATAESVPSPATMPAPSAPLSRRAQAAAAAAAKKVAIKARIAKKHAAAVAAAAKRRARVHKSGKALATATTSGSHSASSAAIVAPSRASLSRSTDAPRGRGDPDDTLPITD